MGNVAQAIILHKIGCSGNAVSNYIKKLRKEIRGRTDPIPFGRPQNMTRPVVWTVGIWPPSLPSHLVYQPPNFGLYLERGPGEDLVESIHPSRIFQHGLICQALQKRQLSPTTLLLTTASLTQPNLKTRSSSKTEIAKLEASLEADNEHPP